MASAGEPHNQRALPLYNSVLRKVKSNSAMRASRISLTVLPQKQHASRSFNIPVHLTAWVDTVSA